MVCYSLAMTAIIRVALEDDLHAELVAAAALDDRPLSSWVRVAIREKLEKLKREAK